MRFGALRRPSARLDVRRRASTAFVGEMGKISRSGQLFRIRLNALTHRKRRVRRGPSEATDSAPDPRRPRRRTGARRRCRPLGMGCRWGSSPHRRPARWCGCSRTRRRRTRPRARSRRSAHPGAGGAGIEPRRPAERRTPSAIRTGPGLAGRSRGDAASLGRPRRRGGWACKRRHSLRSHRGRLRCRCFPPVSVARIAESRRCRHLLRRMSRDKTRRGAAEARRCATASRTGRAHTTRSARSRARTTRRERSSSLGRRSGCTRPSHSSDRRGSRGDSLSRPRQRTLHPRSRAPRTRSHRTGWRTGLRRSPRSSRPPPSEDTRSPPRDRSAGDPLPPLGSTTDSRTDRPPSPLGSRRNTPRIWRTTSERQLGSIPPVRSEHRKPRPPRRADLAARPPLGKSRPARRTSSPGGSARGRRRPRREGRSVRVFAAHLCSRGSTCSPRRSLYNTRATSLRLSDEAVGRRLDAPGGRPRGQATARRRPPAPGQSPALRWPRRISAIPQPGDGAGQTIFAPDSNLLRSSLIESPRASW